MNALLHPLAGYSRGLSLIAAGLILIAVPITVVAGLNVSPILTRASACYDVSGEGLVDSRDYELISSLIAENGYEKDADANQDGQVNHSDGALVNRHLNQVCSPEVTFFADPKTIKPGGTSTLIWSVKYAESISITGLSGVATEGETKITPTENTSYSLRVTGPAGTVTATTRVEIQP